MKRGAVAVAVLATAAVGVTWGIRSLAGASAGFGGGTREIAVTARNYAFDAPETVAAGTVTFRLMNQGPALHHVWLVRLDQGKTLSDLLAAFQAGGPPPTWAVDVGGPNATAPGHESRATLVLAPGEYAIVCMIPAEDGVPHVMKGMAHALHVTGSAPAGSLPRADAQMTLSDYDFALTQPLHPGRRVIRVRNVAAQTHEVVVARLAPGKTAESAVAWLEKPEGPPPGEPIGGISGIAPGRENEFTVDLAAGEYALICFVPDAKDGKPHFTHGMVKQIRIG